MLATTMNVPILHTAATLLLQLLLITVAPSATAAVGCALTNPEDDLRTFFPEMTDFSTRYLTFQAQAPDRHALLQKGIGDQLDPVYETPDVPYTLYSVRSNGATLGYVFGANQRGTYSNIQVIAVTRDDLSLKNVYLQKIRSPVWEAFRSEDFSRSLSKRSLKSYPDLRDCYVAGRCEAIGITDPSGGKEPGDFQAILRALAKLDVLTRLLLEPGVEQPGHDAQARSERVTSWWHGEPTGQAIRAPRWSSIQGAPWPDDEPVLVWRGQRDAVIVPLAVLATHPVVNAEIGGREIAITWSAFQATAVALERPQGVMFEPTTELLHGVMLVTSSDDRSQWSTALSSAVRGVGTGRATEIAAGPVQTTFAQAARVAPEARVLLSDERDEISRLIEVRKRLTARRSRGVDRAEVVAIGSARHGVVLKDTTAGITRVRLADQDIAVLQCGALRAAYAEDRPHGLVFLGQDPFGGAPWLWDADRDTLYEGVTGSVLHGSDAADPLQPISLYGMDSDAFKALHPKMPLTVVSAR